MTDQAALGFNGGQVAGQQSAQPVSPPASQEGGAQAEGAQAQAQYVTMEDAKRMMQEAVAEALRQAQSHTDKSVAHLTEQFAAKPQADGKPAEAKQQANTQAESGTSSPISQERIEWANREAAKIYEMLGVSLTAEEDDAPFRALLDESSPESFVKSLPAAVMAKRLARGDQQQTTSEPPANPAARTPALSSGGVATRTQPKYSDIPDLIGKGLNQPLPRKR